MLRIAIVAAVVAALSATPAWSRGGDGGGGRGDGRGGGNAGDAGYFGGEGLSNEADRSRFEDAIQSADDLSKEQKAEVRRRVGLEGGQHRTKRTTDPETAAKAGYLLAKLDGLQARVDRLDAARSVPDVRDKLGEIQAEIAAVIAGAKLRIQKNIGMLSNWNRGGDAETPRDVSRTISKHKMDVCMASGYGCVGD